MTLADFEVQQKILRSKTSPEEYAIYKAALEWALTDPIVIESKDDFKCKRGSVSTLTDQWLALA